MKKNRKYVEPAILDHVTLELEAEILGSSNNVGIDDSIRSVETTGQEVGGTVGADQWTRGWE